MRSTSRAKKITPRKWSCSRIGRLTCRRINSYNGIRWRGSACWWFSTIFSFGPDVARHMRLLRVASPINFWYDTGCNRETSLPDYPLSMPGCSIRCPIKWVDQEHVPNILPIICAFSMTFQWWQQFGFTHNPISFTVILFLC
jgi:hypothetical protein